jgi:hypothetical protein
MSDQVSALGGLIRVGRQWARARAAYRRVVDSKKATKDDVERARKECVKLSNELEQAFALFEKVVGRGRGLKKVPIDWGQILGVVSKVAGGIEQAVKARGNNVIHAEVIDTKGESV